MKPQKLVMSAFGSYAEEITIDFTKANHGIFLITGDTGAGKTTIFDAIVYALYDRMSGGAREAADMRSQYADAAIPTYVSYTFTYGEETYTIRRNPKYSRISKRKDKDGNYKETIEQPQAELILPDGSVFAGKLRETNEKIIEIVGLDADQFTQIAMIAQGEFMRLLQAPSNKRKEIFAKIFNTRIYWQFQEELKRRTKTLYGRLEDNRKYCEMELAAVQKLPEYALPEQEQEEQTPYDSLSLQHGEELLAALNELVEQGKKAQKYYQEQVSVNQQQKEHCNMELSAAKQVNGLFEQLARSQAEQEKLKAEQEEYTSKEEALQAAQKAALVAAEEEKVQRQQTQLQNSQQTLQEYEQQLLQQGEKLEQARLQLQQQEEKRQEQEPQLQEQLTRLRDMLPVYEQAQEAANSIQKQEKETAQALQQLETDRQQLLDFQQRLVQQHTRTQQELQAYESKNDSFIAEQAGIMAQTLQEGEPCPVCGAVHHPQKAALSQEAATQEQVRQAKEKWMTADQQEQALHRQIEQARKQEQEQQTRCHTLQSALENAKAQYEILRKGLTYASKAQAAKQVSKLEKELTALKDESQKLQDIWQKTKNEQAQTAGMKAEQEELKKRLEKELTAAEKMLEKTLQKQGFSSRQAYQAALMTAKQMEQIQKALMSYHDACIRNQEALSQYEKQTKGKQKIETGDLTERIKELQQACAKADKYYKELYSRNRRNAEIQAKLMQLLEERKELLTSYEQYSNLDKTANGNLAGTAKLDFQTYIQRRYFETIIQEANKRLIQMTSNQFILQCRSLDKLGSQGAVGLDLDVYSLVNDKTRDVKTLSGGESFMAALAMALGMSDVIQNTAGRVKLDTMFVDEGFGSLDDEARGEAVKILHELAGEKRLVGIISHVTELKEQIDRKLIVKKDEKGSHVFWTES